MTDSYPVALALPWVTRMNAFTRVLGAVVVLSSMVALADGPKGNAAAGKAVFLQNCALCHGNEGHGDGPAAAGLTPKPANFIDVARLSTPADKQVRIVTNGGASEKLSPLMPAFGDSLSPQQILDAVTFIRDNVQASAIKTAVK
jgi:mono/diheme cytochrome c family protein